MNEAYQTKYNCLNLEDEGEELPFTILVAEDDSDDAVYLERAFDKVDRRIPIQVVTDGEQVKAYLERRPPFNDPDQYPTPSLLLLDLRMPRLDGFGVLEWLLWHPELRPRFVVVLSASDYPEDLRRATVLGADSYLLKPQDPAALVRIVKGISEYWLEEVEGVAAGR